MIESAYFPKLHILITYAISSFLLNKVVVSFTIVYFNQQKLSKSAISHLTNHFHFSKASALLSPGSDAYELATILILNFKYCTFKSFHFHPSPRNVIQIRYHLNWLRRNTRNKKEDHQMVLIMIDGKRYRKTSYHSTFERPQILFF